MSLLQTSNDEIYIKSICRPILDTFWYICTCTSGVFTCNYITYMEFVKYLVETKEYLTTSHKIMLSYSLVGTYIL